MAEERNYSEEVARLIDEEVRHIIDECYSSARSILEEHRDKLDRLVEVLLERETLDRAEVEAILAGEELPPMKVPVVEKDDPTDSGPKDSAKEHEKDTNEKVVRRPVTDPPTA